MADKGIISLETVLKEIGATNWSSLDKDQMYKLIEMAGKGRIEQAHLEQIISLAPKVVPMAVQALKSVPELARHMAESQKAAFDANAEIFKALVASLEKIANCMTTDEERHKIVDRIMEAARMAFASNEKISKENASSWISLGGILKFGVAAVVVVMGGPKALAAIRK